MRNLDDFLYFEAVVRHGGFGAASRALNIAKSNLSRRIKDLETRLGVRLIERSTHHFSVTEIGNIFYRHCQVALAEIEAAEEAAMFLTGEARGLVRASCPPGLPMNTLAAALPSFLRDHPHVRVQLTVAMRRVDIIEERIDVAIRVRSRLDTDNELVAKQLGVIRTSLVASPDFIAEHGEPQFPHDLVRLPTLGGDDFHAEETWVLNGPTGRQETVRHVPLVASNSLSVVLQQACDGLGVALLPELLSAPALRSGRLRRVLPDWSADEGILHLVFTSRRGMLPAVRAFIDFASDALRTAMTDYEECLSGMTEPAVPPADPHPELALLRAAE
ncbi:LysR family transcriptional regulator [Aurantimonas sp. MSK8Z-1]|uniref:LysR family transcriptional regulator n=1 Tax=Mangrovibrevibacter kandeliae TaxID=2968473 RepID=UPI0021179551|nr:LysR family transcriptional regulator [Aurantimonas sp. MSK8Z-1]MCW4115519.1 LysR family transcriptional regulator [Aurantimonas sp. MSK8Z-1]